MSLLVRPALSADIPSIANIDIAASSAHPLTASLISASFSGTVSAFISLYQHLFSLPHYHFLIAEIDGQPVGFTAWKEGGVHEPDNFLPEMPEGADTKLIGYFMETVKAHKAGLGIEELAELQILSICPEYQRKGVGSALLKLALEESDKNWEKMYVRSSAEGRGLYEKFEWKVTGTLSIELKEFGLEGDITWDMIREVGKENK
ncbi:hypothetical protein OIDMADRAFT_181868 [Oidiodendron maius Zn]|uniref:N-acetyltransferase domain-containing protein n=1 Tax=Oidiodendron maius (strain Zn) TaxID=913774 RepID=A0A0C3GR55_OIDMZ|nr:hypothetical protein OIDMADRAFT_181868 [Oidiodendron maius Zn]